MTTSADEEQVPVPATGLKRLEEEGEIAADYLEELLDIADLDGDIDTYIEGDRAHVSIVSESQVLVGSNGEVLDALQELTRLAVMTETGDRRRRCRVLTVIPGARVASATVTREGSRAQGHCLRWERVCFRGCWRTTRGPSDSTTGAAVPLPRTTPLSAVALVAPVAGA